MRHEDLRRALGCRRQRLRTEHRGDVLPSATALDDSASYSPSSLPDLSSDVTFVGNPPYASTVFTLAAGGDFNVAGNAPVTINAPLNDPAGGGGSLTLTKTGAGTLILTGNNTYTGSLTVSAGTLAITAGSFGVANAPATFTVDGAGAGPTVTLSGNATLTTADSFVGFQQSGTFVQTGGTHFHRQR